MRCKECLGIGRIVDSRCANCGERYVFATPTPLGEAIEGNRCPICGESSDDVYVPPTCFERGRCVRCGTTFACRDDSPVHGQTPAETWTIGTIVGLVSAFLAGAAAHWMVMR